MSDPAYGFSRLLDGVPFDAAYDRTVAALQAEGFGVITEIDVKATMAKKLGVEFRDYKILGACNPPIAHRALTVEPLMGLLLPCNVVVAREETGTRVSMLSPTAMFSLVNRADAAPLADEVEARLKRALAAV